MDTEKKTNGKASAESAAPEAANVEKIRDILFGGQMRDYDKRFNRLEERLAKAAEALREETKKRIETLEGFVHQEVEALNQRLKVEKAERMSGLKDLERGGQEAAKSAEKKMTQMEETFAKEAGDLRARLLEQTKHLTTELEQKHRSLSAALDREVQALQTDKPDRKALADLFTELAMRLRKEFVLPQGK